MKKEDVELGAVYAVNVAGRIRPVRIVRESFACERTLWYGTNLDTGRQIIIRSARRLRRRLYNQPEGPVTGGVGTCWA